MDFLSRFLLTTCIFCDRIREGTVSNWNRSWNNLQEYLLVSKLEEPRIVLSHGCCPDCFEGVRLDQTSSRPRNPGTTGGGPSSNPIRSSIDPDDGVQR